MNRLEKTIVALDDMDANCVHRFLQSAEGKIKLVKMGPALFYTYGRAFVQEIQSAYNVDIFLDLKLHDIPNTVSGAIRSLASLPVRFLTVHLGGGPSMLKAALESCRVHLPSTALLGVSILTSLDEKEQKKIWGSQESSTLYKRLFDLSFEVNLHGTVLSPQELELFKTQEKKHARQLIKVTPGIRFNDEIAGGKSQDQKRISSPKQAFDLGTDFIVIGRSLTQAPHLPTRLRELNSEPL